MFGKNDSKNRKARGGVGAVERLDLSGWHFAEVLPEGRYIDLPRRGKAFVRVARGPRGAPAVLLVHGLMATADLNWSLVMPELAERFTVVAPDLRGHGRGLPTSRFTGEECAADLAAIVETMELGRVIVVGYSLGGLVAQLFARLYPNLTAGLVLCATACRFEVPTERGALHLLERIVRRAPESLRRALMMAMLAPKQADSPNGRWLVSEVRRHNTLAILDATAEAARFDSASWLALVDTPAVVIVTSLDPIVKPACQRVLAVVLGADVYEVDADHSAPVMRPDLFNPALAAACTRVAGEHSSAPAGSVRALALAEH
jgi:pimeloyl-ACP methyl ester carboxylesterase